LIASIGILIGSWGVAWVDSDVVPHAKLITAIAGGLIMITGIFLWALEGADGYHIHLDKDGKIIDEKHH
jgi:cytochrome c oxidase subunit 1